MNKILLAAMLLMGGTAAAQEPEPQHVIVGGNVYGGGNLAAVSGSTTVLLDQENAVVTGDVYGGGALANVGTSNSNTTTVTLLQGAVNGDVYGGGLGRNEERDNEDNITVTAVEALVNGVVTINIGSGTVDGSTGFATSTSGAATIGGSVFGCNNVNGTPKDDVFVNIYQTAHTEDNAYPSPEPSEEAMVTPAAATAFAIKNVYGGGNKAAYDPVDNTKAVLVHIYTCANTIQTVYGGGNAADATKVGLTIDGGRFDRIFGGGNGYSATGNHNDPTAENYNPGANISVSATTQIHGGLYRQVFGGSNQYGDVASASLSIDKSSPCSEIIAEAFGGANEADITGNIETTLECSASNVHIGNFYGGSNLASISGNVTLNVIGGSYTHVYGGSKGRAAVAADPEHGIEAVAAKAANIGGNVTLNLYGGTITTAFGGSNIYGNIGGNIIVNVEDTSTRCPLSVDTVYGAGNLTAYTPNTPGAYPKVNIKNGTVGGNVYGGGFGPSAIVTSNPVVTIGDVTEGHEGYVATVGGSVYGGGFAAPVDGNTTVVMTKANSSASKLFGGGANAGVTGNTSVTLTNGTVLDGIFGGSDTTGTITGNTEIALNGGNVGTSEHPANYDICGGGWGLSTRVGGNVRVTLNGSTVYSDIYGGSYYGDVNTNSSNTTTINLTSGSIDGNVYGGGFGDSESGANALVNGAVTVNATGVNMTIGNEGGNIFGCNNDNGAPQSTVTVNVTGGTIRSVLGGGNQASYGGTPVITVSGGTITKRVVGGGYAAGVGGSSITISGGNIATAVNEDGCGIYGGCYSKGDVSGDITVSVTGGTIGTDATHRANIHGGGYGNETSSTGDVTVTFGNSNASHQNTPVLYGDIYGGSGFGDVNTNTSNTTTVNVLNGEITGDVYGGGLGQKGDDSDPEHIIPAYPALVNGNVVVNIGESTSTGKVKFNTYNGGDKGGMVFGANNANGTPKGNVTVNIYATDHGVDIAHNLYPSPAPSTAADLATNAATQTYAIAAVFGGGNEASYTPVADKSATVHVYNCDNTIKDVYGGGNAADVGTTGEGAIPANTYVVIDGGRIHRVFGGGNGEVTPAHTYGTATTTVNAGLIDQIFGCGNMQGSITATDLQLLKTGSCSDEVWGEVFGGANQAAFAGDLSTTIGCGVGTIGDIYGGSNKASITGNVTLTIKGGTYVNVFGGSKGVKQVGTEGQEGYVAPAEANISGGVTLNLYGGTIGNAFGGSNQNGNIDSTITVNVLNHETTNCGLTISENIYGASNVTPYTPTKLTEGAHSPVVNVIHGSIGGSVYGGAKGDGATVTADPIVNFGYDATTMASLAGVEYPDGNIPNRSNYLAVATVNVYGGGDAAAVTGSTTVKMYKSNSQVANLFGGGNAAGVSGGADVTLADGTVTGGLYGGCNASGSVGAITMTLTGGAVGTELVHANVFGGGYGHITTTTNNIDITLNGTTVYGDLYGGSALGSVNSSTDDTTTITVRSNTLHGTLFGGGEGSGSDASTRATTNGNIVINYNSENTYLVGGIYGGANINGAVAGDINVNVNANVGASGDGNSRDIFGGGLGQHTATDGNTTVTVGASGSPVIYGDLYGGSSLGEVGATGKTSKADLQGGTLNGTIYGGGKGDNSTAALVSGGSEASVSGGTVSGGVYGGCNANGTVTQASAVNITGGTIGADGATANVYGGGLGASTKVKGDIDVTINGASATIWGDVYGGSAKGLVNCNDAGTAHTEGATTDVTLTAGTIHGSLYGGGHGIDNALAHVWGPVQVTVNGGTVTDEIYGCNNAAGSPQSTVNVDIYGTDQPGSGYALSKVFGGGNAADYAGTPVVKVHNCDNKIEYVYGGGNAATVNGTDVTIYGGNTIGNVFGGCYGADVNGNTLVNIYGGVIDNVFGGNNASHTINGTITVNINSVVDADPNGSSTACPMNARNVFGGGNLAAYGGTPDVNILGGTAGNVFGGGNEATVNGTDVDMTGGTVANIYGGGNEAGVTTSTDVNISGGLVTTGIYGGCNTTGTVGTNSTIALLGGQVGTNAVRADICGGGYGQPTKVDGDVHITMGNAAGTATPIIYGNLYGGSALGNVNTNSSKIDVENNDYVNETNTTTIDLLSGTFTGNVFGGGLGRQAIEDDPETGEDESAPAIAALVHGVVQINVGRNTGDNESPVYTGAANLKNASIYGCNNVNGSPQSDVHIDVYATAHPTQTLVTDTTSDRSYAIANLYGGGNRANYEPVFNTPYSTSEWNLMKLIYVHVHGCDNTIGEFFGGGNAADVDGDSVIIDGGRFNEVFGGGNGAAKAANIGNGGIHLEVKAGRVGYLFEECNKRGNLEDGAPKNYKHGGGSCNDGILQIDYHFCGGNIQDVIGDSVYTFTCAKNVRYVGLYGGCRLGCHYGNIKLVIEGGTIQEVYGGSQGSLDYSADVRKYPYLTDVLAHPGDYPEKMEEFLTANPEKQGTGGNVTVEIKGGKIGSVFGGCNTRGNVEGRITIIIDSTKTKGEDVDDCALDLDYVYGGGNLAAYEPDSANSSKTCYTANYQFPHIDLRNGHVNFDVFGGGHGADSNLTAGLVVANPKILMNPDVENGKNFWVKGNIYGGGEMGSVGNYTRDANGKPTDCEEGKTTITISAGRVGPSTLTMPTFKGHVFGGSKGTVGDTSAITGQPLISHLAYVNNTDITISGTAFIKGSVYGGGESGRVFNNTYVKIQGGQIGCGWDASQATDAARDLNRVYTDAEWLYDVTSDNTKFLYECNHWDYGDPETGKYDPYDPYEHATAYDGHTFYGNVFGGGSGMMPYKAANKDTSIYIQTSGRVCGNTKVEVTGGHILTSLYGGCEMGDVTGDSCVVTFGGSTATLGVPRTLEQIAAHPVTCYLFGAGKGDERVRFNTCTNVENVRVTVDGGTIYGSVFGGGEDGHVMKNVKVEIKPGAKIGTWGTSYVDGNVFGGGRGFSGNALTAGNVGGDVLVNITGGTMLGSIYGGGRLASVGCGLYPANDARYGVMRPDGKHDDGSIWKEKDGSDNDVPRGHITINISGDAIIGNDNRNINGEYDYRSEHPYGGNVFGGSMGRLVKMDGSYILDHWSKLGCAKQTIVNISENAQIKSNVYGGSELGSITENTAVNISGGTIGRAGCHGNVYGGGYGSDTLTSVQLADQARRDSVPVYSGRTYGSTELNLTGGHIYGSVYGGGERASIGIESDSTKGNTLVNIGTAATTNNPTLNHSGSVTIDGIVFGANNISGTPLGNTAVHIYKTAHGDTPANNKYPPDIDTKEELATNAGIQTYALSAVYGGGNYAEHAPIAKKGTTLVHVHYCEENTIGEVYGGGNAADSKNNSVIIDGGRIHSVFGGGNGYSATKNHDNPSAANYNPGADASGIATTAIHGGLIDTVYGGSNQYGYINQINLIIDNIPEDPLLDPEHPCAQIVGGLFGAGNESFGGGGEVTIACGSGNFSEVYGGAKMADIGTAEHPSFIRLNVQGGTIGKVFGGSMGRLADDSDPEHPITAVPANIYGDITVNVTGGTIGYVYGGSNYNGNVTGSITVNIDSTQAACPLTISDNVYGASYITMYQPTDRDVESPVVNIKHGTVGGSVFGGGDGQGARTLSNPAVYMGNGDYTNALLDPNAPSAEARVIDEKPVVKGNIYGGGNAARVFGNTLVQMDTGTVDGSIYAAGKGKTYAELGVDAEKETRAIVDGWTTLNMSGGLVKDCLYGGGELGQVGHLDKEWSKYSSETTENKAKYGNAYVTMTGGTVGAEGAAATHGNVYGSGKGNNESPITGRVQGNTFVTITNGLVRHNVYGGGSLATVGTFTYTDNKPTSYTSGGTATVYITGGTIGTNGSENGMVYGSSRGEDPTTANVSYIDGYAFVNNSKVIMGDTTAESNNSSPAVKGSLYGGGENGHVFNNTYVRIHSGIVGNPDIISPNMGNVYGAGCGTDTYIPTGETAAKHVAEAGVVRGNTFVNITGGHVTRSVYGAGSMGAVGRYTYDGSGNTLFNASSPATGTGNSTVYITGGTIGRSTMYDPVVPDDPEDPDDDDLPHNLVEAAKWYKSDEGNLPADPGSGCVFGAGRGIESSADSLFCNTNNSRVFIGTDASLSGYPVNSSNNPVIYGSVFGGAANGHVVGSTDVNVHAGTIGTYAISSWDGNVFGGGEGSGYYFDHYDTDGDGEIDDGEDYNYAVYRSCGRVAGNTSVTVDGGHIKGTVYGGGRLALTGVDQTGSYSTFVTSSQYDSVNHGRTTVNISGTTTVIGMGSTDAEAEMALASDYSVGDIFGSGRGDVLEYIDVPAGRTANTSVTVSGSPTIYGAVFGGGEMAGVGYWTDAAGHPFVKKTGTSRVNIAGGTFGTPYEYDTTYLKIARDDPDDWTVIDIYKEDTLDDTFKGRLFHACTGNIIGASQGDVDTECPAWISMGRSRQAFVDISGGTIMGNVYGGAEQGVVMENTYVTVSGGEIGTLIPAFTFLDSNSVKVVCDTHYFGSVFGGGYGSERWGGTQWPTADVNDSSASPSLIAGRTYGNTNVEISGSAIIHENVYGGGNMASVGYVQKVAGNYALNDTTKRRNGLCTVNIIGGTVGPHDHTLMNGHVYGAGKGVGYDPDEHFKEYCNVNSTILTVNGGHIYGSTFGGGADCHVLGSTNTYIQPGAYIGSDEYTEEYDGCVIGGGRNALNVNHTAGRVLCHTHVTVTGGRIERTVLGGGALARTGVDVDGNIDALKVDGKYDSAHYGYTYVKVSGTTDTLPLFSSTDSTTYALFLGTTDTVTVAGVKKVVLYNTTIGAPDGPILVDNDYTIGDIFGGGKGDTKDTVDIMAGKVMNTNVYVYGSPRIMADIYAGGEMSCIGWYDTTGGNTGVYYPKTGFTKVVIDGSPRTGTPYEFSCANIHYGRPWTLIDSLGWLYHTCSGNVYGGGQGYVEQDATHRWNWVQMGRVYQTHVTINGGDFMGNVFGGGSRGIVKDDCYVTINGGTFGTHIVDDTTIYDTTFVYDTTYVAELIDHIDTSVDHIDTLVFNNRYNYGSIFGGGYGNHKIFWHYNDSCFVKGTDTLKMQAPEFAGRVYGNTHLEITGGHIMGNVYGGGDMASTGYVLRDEDNGEFKLYDNLSRKNGVCNVIIRNDTTGTGLSQVIRIPVIGPHDHTLMNGHVYGAGKGVPYDPKEIFKRYCNVNETNLTVSGGHIYGSTFGGGADCHVLGHTRTTIHRGAYIGSDEYTEEYDGCVFGGGRNAKNSNGTAGRVQGHTYITVDGGRIQRTILGGGALARTGVDTNGLVTAFVDANNVYDSVHHGSTNIKVSGTYDDVATGEMDSDYNKRFKGTTTTEGVASGKVRLHHTTIGVYNGPILVDNDYTIGDIFGGGKGDTKDTVDILAGKVMNTYVKVSGSPRIMADVYAGGEMSCVGWYDTTGANTGVYYPRTGYTHVEISGDPRTGTPYEFSCANIHYGRPWTLIDSIGRLYHTCSGNVYGGGQGYVEEDGTHRWNWVQMGRVYQTEVKIHGGHFMGNVFGGGSRGIVKKDCHVTITGGTFGNHIVDDTTINGKRYNNRYNYGSIFGGGYGNHKTFWHYNDSCFVKGDGTHKGDTIFMQPLEFAGRVYGNTYVTITGGHIMDCVFGGGDMASTGWVERDANGVYLFNDPTKRHGGKCTVNISGNTMVGPLDYFGHNAYVYGAGRGVGYDPTEKFKTYSNINEAELTVALREGPSADATLGPNDWDTTTMGGRIWGSLFGGGADSHVLDDVSTTVNSGVIGTDGSTSYDGNIFGGGRNYLHTNSTNGRVQGNITVTVTHGTLRGSIFGGGRLAMAGIDTAGNYPTTNWDSASHGNVTIDVNTSKGAVSIGNSDSRTLLQSDESNGDIFGSGKGDTKDYDLVWAGQVANVYINVTGSPTIYGSIFGGGEMASLGYWDNTSAFIDGTGYSHIKVGSDSPTATDNPVIGTADEYDYSVYSAPLLPDHADTSARVDGENPGYWTIYDDAGVLVHCCTGNIFGGCQGDVDLKSPNWVTLARGRQAEVIVNHGTIMGSVFGAAEQGVMTGNAYVTINGGTIAANVPANALANFGVYGGGYGSDDPADNASVANDSTDARIALGLPWTADYMAGRLFGNATVNILGGTVKGNVYGGGQMAYIGDDKPTASKSAIPGVNGATLVNIGKESQVGHIDQGPTIEGEIFGANNLMGSPYGNTTVHIYSTAHTETNTCPTAATTAALRPEDAIPADTVLTEEDVNALPHNDNNFALKAVYGGGNHAAHTPLASDGTTNVYVHYCDENTIRDVYGGGNAADTKNNHIVIEGGRIYEVFGGGNGAGEGNPGADVEGTAWTEIKGGLITDVFGGSNSRGNVGNILLDIEKEGDCEMMVANTYGGGNEADGGGGVINLYCGTNAGNFYGGSRNANLTGDIVLNIFGGTYENVFGGSKGTDIKPANITGSVTVNVFGGNIQNLYGGSDVNGNITGKITVNVDLDSAYNCPDGLRLDKVYGGGYDAVYAPTDPTLASPEINIINDTATYTTVDNTDPSNPVVTVTEKEFGIITVFGGGFGHGTAHTYYSQKLDDGKDTLSGQVFANPVVNIGGIEQKWDKTQPGTGTVQNPFGALVDDDWRINRVSIHGNVYGGGEAAPVTGSPMVTLHSSRITKVTGTAPNLDTTFALKNHDTTLVGGSVFGGGYGPTAVINGNTTVGIFGDATVINGNVYGGGEAAILTGSTDVQVGYERIYITQLPQFTVTKNGGTYDVEIYSATPGATIYYTLDGNDPTTSSSVYSTKLTGISAGITVKALAVKPGYYPAVPAVTKVAQP